MLHGEADVVTDPEVSKALYEQASSVDKTLKLYPGMWHGLTSGEPDENIEIVFSDIISWLEKRSSTDHLLVAAAKNTTTASVKPVIYPMDNGIVRTVTSAGEETINRNSQKVRSNRKFLCGLDGHRRLFRHSAM